MKEINQTKEGFIKSMFLFVVLLVICFAPFFAFAGSNPLKTTVKEEIRFGSSDNEIAPRQAITFETGVNFNQTRFSFSTNFECSSYAIEGFNALTASYENILYCNDAMCVDPQQSVEVEYPSNELNYTSYRVKAVLPDGSVLYSNTIQGESADDSEIALSNTAVNDKLVISSATNVSYTYSISDINGILYADNVVPEQNTQIGIPDLSPGFYIISFRTDDGKLYHDKFLKQ